MEFDLIYTIDLIGTFVFAISGVLAAVEKKFDLVGATILGLVTAIGGGTIRDLLIGRTPVGWLSDPNYIYIILASLPICYFFMSAILKLRKGVFLFDTIGIGMFTILGIEKTMEIGLSPIVAIIMGIVSAVFGGVIRDVLSNEIPLIFRKEIYASACFIGGLTYLVFQWLIPNGSFNMIPAIFVVIIIRYLSVKNNWALPFKPN